jgi:glycosyltransferase involved in cell wall biosynthesis
MPNEPRATVIIPSYNHARFLPEAIESVLRQTYRDFEVVIVDDGSTDGSIEVAQAYAGRYPSQVRAHTHPGHANRGISETVNYAFRLSRGEYLSGLPSDDLLYPDKLAAQVAYLDAHPEAGMVYSYADYVDDDGRHLPHLGLFGRDITRDPEPLQTLLQGNVIPGMSVLMRRSAVEAAGDHDPSLLYSDWEFWTRLLSGSAAGFIARPLVKYRVHGYNTSVGVENEENVRRGLAVLDSLKSKADAIGGRLARPRALALLELQRAYHLYRLREDSAARESVESAFASDATLARDDAFLARWLKARVRQVLVDYRSGAHERGFVGWLAKNLPEAAGRHAARRAEAARHALAALESNEGGAVGTPSAAIRCLLQDASWVADEKFRVALARNLAGPKLLGAARRLRALTQGQR